MKNGLDEQYIDLLKDILENGIEKETRNGKTLSVFGRSIRYKFKDGKFPLLTTKKMAWKTMVTELLWFLKGDTNIKYLVDNDCHIWDGDAYKNYYNKSHEFKGDWPDTIEEFVERIKTDYKFAEKWGDLGPIYGKQWRNWHFNAKFDMNGKYHAEHAIDQIQNLINELKTNPDSRRLMVNAWNVADLPDTDSDREFNSRYGRKHTEGKMVLPPCHTNFQVYTRELSESERFNWYGNKIGSHMHHDHIVHEMNENNVPTRAISLMWNQRSVDTFLGLPFNIASYGLLLEIIAKEVNMIPDELIGNLGDTHLYLNHIEQAKEQIKREPMKLPTICLDYREGEYDKDLKGFVPDDFVLFNYQSHPAIKAPLSN
jgi:thymidylate synthase